MPNRLDPARGYTRSTAQLSRSMLNGPLRDFLRDLATRDRVQMLWDFKDIDDVNDFTMAQTQTSTSFTSVADQVGVLQATTANTTTANISMIGKQAWGGNSNVSIEGRFKINTVATTYIIEFGLVDGAPATGASFVTDIDTAGVTAASFVGTNGVVFGIWNNQTHTSFAFASIGSFTSQTVATTLITAATSNFTTPVADTYITARIQLLTNKSETGKTKAYLWVNGILRAQHAVAAGAINGQSNLFPWFYVQTVAAAVKIPTIDYIRCVQDRFALEAASE